MENSVVSEVIKTDIDDASLPLLIELHCTGGTILVFSYHDNIYKFFSFDKDLLLSAFKVLNSCADLEDYRAVRNYFYDKFIL